MMFSPNLANQVQIDYEQRNIKYAKRIERDMSKLQLFKDPKDRIKRSSVELDAALSEQQIVCKKGCSHCCHLFISITEDEATVLAERARECPEVVDMKLLDWQRFVDIEQWNAMSMDRRMCPFLSKEGGSCNVYDIRPAICRTYHSTSDPKYCEVDDAPNIGRDINIQAEIVASSRMSMSKIDRLTTLVWDKMK